MAETTTDASTEPRHMIDIWDREERRFDKKNLKRESGINEAVDRPTFRTHMFSKNAHEREKKHSIASTQITDKTERTDGMYVIC